MTNSANEVECKRLWWLASFPKSGNTWVRSFLEAYVTGRFDLNTFYGQFVYGDQRAADYQSVCGFPLDKAPLTVLNAIRPAVLCRIMANAAGADVCLKTHHARMNVDYIPLIPPQFTKGAVYVIRDPRDVAISWSHHAKKSIDEAIDDLLSDNFTLQMENGVFHCASTWSRHVTTWAIENKGFSPVHVVRYEDLLVDPEAEFRKVITAFKLPFDEQKLANAMKITEFSALKKQEQEAPEGFIERKGDSPFFRNGKSGGWREVLTDEQVARIEGGCREVMGKFGYECQQAAPNLQDAFEPQYAGA